MCICRRMNPYCFFLFSHLSPSELFVQHFFYHQKPGGGYTRLNIAEQAVLVKYKEGHLRYDGVGGKPYLAVA